MTITSQALHNIIVENDYPVKNVTVGDIIFRIRFSPDNSKTLPHSIIEFLSKNVTANAIDGSKLSGDTFIRSLPSPIGRALMHEYMLFQNETGTDILNSLEEWSRTSLSRNLWTVLKETSPSFILTLPEDNKLSVFQRVWIIRNSIEDKVDRNKLIEDVIESLQPWLDREMWIKVKDHRENQRQNWQFDDADIDRRLQEKANRIAKEQQLKNVEEDHDIIEIEDNTNG